MSYNTNSPARRFKREIHTLTLAAEGLLAVPQCLRCAQDAIGMGELTESQCLQGVTARLENAVNLVTHRVFRVREAAIVRARAALESVKVLTK